MAEKPHTLEEHASTIDDSLCIDRNKPLDTPRNRPVLLGHAADPIHALF